MAVDYNPNKHRHIAYKPQDVMNWVLQPWYKEMLSMNHLLVRGHRCPYIFTVQKSAGQIPVQKHRNSAYACLVIATSPGDFSTSKCSGTIVLTVALVVGDPCAQMGHAVDC